MGRRGTLSIPQHRKHKTHNKGYIHCEGKQWWTAEWGTPTANRLYDIFVSIWLEGGRKLPTNLTVSHWKARRLDLQAAMKGKPEEEISYRICDLVEDFLEFSKVHYRKDGKPTQECLSMSCMTKPLIELFAKLPVGAFRPQELVFYRERLIENGLARTQSPHRYLVSPVFEKYFW